MARKVMSAVRTGSEDRLGGIPSSRERFPAPVIGVTAPALLSSLVSAPRYKCLTNRFIFPPQMPTELRALLDASRVTPEFRDDVLTFARTGAAERIVVPRYHPPVKVLRLLMQLLHAESALPISAVEVDGRSGCSDYSGSIAVHTADGSVRTFEFTWCCAWRAGQQGWTDGWGLPDQIRAAHEFGWDCFAVWKERSLETA